MRAGSLLRLLLLLLLTAVAVLGCPGSSDLRRDGSAPPKGDMPKWPDFKGPSTPDTRPQIPDKPKLLPDKPKWPDSYVGTPFGCVQDSDCFGQRCCPTPWGVKLCADDCLQP